MNGWMDTIDLVTVTPGGTDDDGFPVNDTESKVTVFCNVEGT